MLDFANEKFREALADALHQHERFQRHTRWFDGSILIECGETRCWLKVYRGRILETFDHMPLLGYTFKVTGAPQTWQRFIDGERKWPDLITPGARYFSGPEDLARADPMRPPEIRSEGNVLEAQRLVQAISALAECISQCAKARGQ